MLDVGTPCMLVKEWAAPHHREIHGVRFSFYYVWAKGPGYDVRPTVLVCSHEHLRVDELTIGPGAHGASLPCPEIDHHERQTRPLDDGVAWRIANGRPWDMTLVQGGFGHHHDGYWHYKLHNWWLGGHDSHVVATLEGFCSYWR